MIINRTKSLFFGKNYKLLTFSLVKFNSYIHINKNEKSQIQDFRFVPKHQPLKEDDLNEFNNFIMNSKNLFVVSGAGISTESGIPDYRSEEVGSYSRSNTKPIQHSEFMNSAIRRQLYWARNYVSWPIFSSFKPNISHLLFSEWEKKGKIHHHVTQNVDSLLIKAGCLRLTELHGSSYKVKCMDCDFALTRDSMQILIKQQNPNWSVISNELAPDNDVKLTNEQVKDFKTPICPKCKNDRLKPEVVFFGDNIPRNKVEFVKSKLSECDALLAVGTSLEVYSAYRIILNAKELNIPICIVNIGKTRADKLADLKINALCSQILSKTKF